MPWWGWIIFGAFLLGAELFGVDAAFYLIFIGFAAILMGLIDLSGVQLEPWVQWLLFAGLAIFFMVLFRKRLYKKFRGVDTDYEAGPTGKTLRLLSDLEPGATCRMDYRGSTWTILNSGAGAIAKGEDARIKGTDGTTLIVESTR